MLRGSVPNMILLVLDGTVLLLKPLVPEAMLSTPKISSPLALAAPMSLTAGIANTRPLVNRLSINAEMGLNTCKLTSTLAAVSHSPMLMAPGRQP